MYTVYLEKSFEEFESKDDALREFVEQFSKQDEKSRMVCLKEIVLSKNGKAKCELLIARANGMNNVELGNGITISADDVMCALIGGHGFN